jgi:antitoxin component YwqK of YwqJK toxin-antitoxin module
MRTRIKMIWVTLCAVTVASMFTACSGGSKPEDKRTLENKNDTLAIPGKKENPDVIQPKASFDTLQNGDFVARYPNGVIQMKGYYKNGKREGEWASFFPSGQVQSEGFFTQGKRDHKGVVYYDNGKIMYEGMYKDGIQVGIWKFYNNTGVLKQTVDYDKAQ